MSNEIKELFEEFAQLAGYKTSSERIKKPTKGNYYKNEFIIMSHAPIYGGYVINIVLRTTGQRDFDGYTRKTKKEMINYLRGLIKGLTIKNN